MLSDRSLARGPERLRCNRSGVVPSGSAIAAVADSARASIRDAQSGAYDLFTASMKLDDHLAHGRMLPAVSSMRGPSPAR